MDLRWEGDDKNQYLFAGCNLAELAWLKRGTNQWFSVIWLPGVHHTGMNTLAAHQKIIEEKVQHWFGLANTGVPARDAE